MSGSVGVASEPDVETEFRQDVGPSSGFEMGLGAQPTQPPHPPVEIELVPSSVSGYHDVPGATGTSSFHIRMTTGDDVVQGTADLGDISTTTMPTSNFRFPSV